MQDNLSILKAVTRTTYPTNTLESDAPPSPIVHLSENSGDSLDLSFAFISTKSIDIPTAKKELEDQQQKHHDTAQALEAPLLVKNKGESQNERTTQWWYIRALVFLLLVTVIGLWVNDKDCIRQEWVRQGMTNHWDRQETFNVLRRQAHQWLHHHYDSLRDFIGATVHSMDRVIDQYLFFGNLSRILTGHQQ